MRRSFSATLSTILLRIILLIFLFSWKSNQDGIPLYLPYFLAYIYCLSLQGRNGSDMITLKVFMRHKNINSTASFAFFCGVFLLAQAPFWKDKRDAGWITERSEVSGENFYQSLLNRNPIHLLYSRKLSGLSWIANPGSWISSETPSSRFCL